jgi:high-affinity K+ transport system ATPase subunit B
VIPRMIPTTPDDRAAISYVDVVLTGATLIMIAVVAPMLFNIYNMLQGVADPLTVALLQLLVPLLVIGLIVSMGVAARS